MTDATLDNPNPYESPKSETAPPADHDKSHLPPLMADWSFWGMTATGFLGAMNDNIYQNLLKFLVIDLARRAGEEVAQKTTAVNDGQWLPMLLMGVPFVIFSGFAGVLSDRNSKQVVVYWSKVAEIVCMALGLVAFWVVPWIGSTLCQVVMFMMAAQSAFYGPAKYGILPEMLREEDMPQATGITLMATFVSIILGTVLGGMLYATFKPIDPTVSANQLMIAQTVCVVVAIVGTITTLPIRRHEPAQPGLEFHWQDWAVPQDTWNLMFEDIVLWWAVLASCIFWAVGSIVQAVVISFGTLQLQLSEQTTGLMAGVLAIGIAVGSVCAGMFKSREMESRFVTYGAWGIALFLLAMSALGYWLQGLPDAARQAKQNIGFYVSLGLLFPLGVATGVFVVPIQVFLQDRPPDEQKGRMIACQAFCNWIAISLAALIYFGLEWLIHAANWPRSSMFAITALLLVPVALLYRLPLDEKPTADEPTLAEEPAS